MRGVEWGDRGGGGEAGGDEDVRCFMHISAEIYCQVIGIVVNLFWTILSRFGAY